MYSQHHGIDYNKVLALVAKWDTIRTIIALVALKVWCIFQLDVKSAFLHGKLNKKVFVEQPHGYQKSREEDRVYKLKKDLYGLKQAPQAWYNKTESYFCKEGFEQCPYEDTLFVKSRNEQDLLIITLYVDDLIFTRTSSDMFLRLSSSLCRMSWKDEILLRQEIMQQNRGIFICQSKYALKVLEIW